MTNRGTGACARRVLRWMGGVCLVLAFAATPVEAAQLHPVPITPADPPLTVGPSVVIESQPSVGPALSTTQDQQAVSMELHSGQVAKTIGPGSTNSLPLGQGQIEAVIRFPVAVDGAATAVTLQQSGGNGSWQLLGRAQPAPDQVTFVLQGTRLADLVIQVRPPLGAPPIQFGVHLTPSTVITTADAGQTVQLEQGARFSLELGTGYIWSVSVADPTIVSPADDGSGYEALQPGTTTLFVSGDPACYHARPACLVPSLGFEVYVVVV